MLKHAFEGIKVVDLAAYIAGAYCSALLTDMGAEVVKVESPTGDGFRALGGGFQGWNRGKRGMVVDLTKPEGREILHTMVKDADVVMENYRPGVSERLGANYETLAEINPGIIYCSITGYGSSGPFSERPAFDPLMQAQSGAMAAQGGDGKPPVFLHVAISDYAAAMLGAYGIAMALFHRLRTGQGQRLETCLLNAAIAVQAEEFFSYQGKPTVHRVDSFGIDSTYRMYKAQDGWLFLSCDDDASWSKLCNVLDLNDLLSSSSLKQQRMKRDQELGKALEEIFSRAPLAEWLIKLEEAGVRCAPVTRSQDMHGEPQAVHNGLTVAADSPDLGLIKQLGLPIRLSRTPGKVWGPAPALGQHTDEVLLELGKTRDEIASLRARKVVG